MSVGISTLPSAREIATGFLFALAVSRRHDTPYRYWLLSGALPVATARALDNLPVEAPTGLEFNGRRETNNASRFYFNAEAQAIHPVARAVAEAFQSSEVVAGIERECEVDLTGTSLRIEFCQDTDGFWLEPHTDIGVKRFTLSIYLCRDWGADELGTDIYDEQGNHVARAPSPFNSAMLFIPGKNTFHGFERRPIKGVRRSMIVNYVGPEWRSRQELAYPLIPVK